jgi:hypothetical protein
VFDLEVGTNGLIVATTADFLAQIGGSTIFRLHAQGALLINASGIAAKIVPSAGANPDKAGNASASTGPSRSC